MNKLKLSMLLTMLFCVVLTHAQTFEVDGISYNVTKAPDGELSGEVEVIAQSAGYSGNLVIPAQITVDDKIYQVTSIGDWAFENCYNLVSVTLGDQLLNIGQSAFYGCGGLSSITIPKSVKTISLRAFQNCVGLKLIISEILTPFALDAFSSFDATLVVPKGLRADYKSVGGWDFAIIFEEGETIYDREQTDGQGLNFTLKQADNYSFYYSVTGHSDELNTEIVIPADLGGCPVKSIENNVFNGCANLLSITIPNSVTSIGARVFQSCSNITDVTLGDQLTTIGKYAFSECTSLSSIIIPNSVTELGEFAFYGCSSMTSVTIGNNVTELKAGTFFGCSGLNTILIPNNVTSIEDKADVYWGTDHSGGGGTYGVFSNCSGLTSVTIGSGVTQIGSYAFQGCNKLASIKMGKNVNSIGDYSFNDCTSLSSIVIPNSVTSLGGFAFQNCRNLTSVTIGNGLTCLKAGTFYGCSGLSYITIGSGVTSIEDVYYDKYFNKYGVFTGCSSLISITIPNNVEHIGSYAFSGCGGLASVSLGDGIISIGEDAFSNCGITSITIPGSVTNIGQRAFAFNNDLAITVLEKGITEIVDGMFYACRNLSNVVIPEGVTHIGSDAFWVCALPSIKLPETLTSMGENALGGCPLKSIELPNSFTIISDNLFSANNLQYIKLGNNVKSIGANAFGSSETVIEIGTSIPPTIAADAFPNIEYLSDINVIVPDAKAETAYHKAAVWQDMTFANQNNISEVTVETAGDLGIELITQCNMTPAKVVSLKVNGTINADDFTQMLVNMKSLLRLDLTDCNITEIPDNALKGKQQLRELILPTKLLTIGQSAFQGCTFLQALTMQTGLQTIGKSAFQGCGYLTGQLDLPSTVTTIGQFAFVGTGYTSVKLPSALKTIGDYAFHNLSIKQKLTLPKKVTSVGAYAFAGTKITELEIPDGVTSIGDYAFASTPIQGHVTIPDGVTTLGKYAFSGSQLSTVFLPNSIETLSDGLFQGCPNLDLVYVPDNFTGLASSAFDGCGALTILRLSANLASMGEYALQSTPLEYIKIPSQVEILSRGVLKNCKNLEFLSLPASLKMVEGEAFYGCTALRNLSVEALDPPTIKDKSAIRGINTDLCLISIPTQSYRKYVLAEYWGQFVQMRNDIAVETTGNGEIAFESVEENEDEEEVQARAFTLRNVVARASRRGQQLATEEESMTYANNGSSIYVPQQGKVRFYIIPAEGEQILSATLDGEDIMPYIVDGVYTATADKRNAKLVVVFSNEGQGSAGLQGDVNGDGTVSVTDVGCVINYILEQVPETFIYAAADMNGDESISVTDVGYIINYILNDGTANNRAANHVTNSYGVPMLMLNTGGYVLTLDGADAFIGFQMDILIPEDANSCNVQLKNTDSDHQLICRRLSSGHYRVVCYSPTNETFQKGLTDLLTFASESNMTISNIRFTTAGLEEVRFADMGATPTGIANVTGRKTNDIKVYTLDGRLYRTVHVKPGENPLKDLQPGVYLINEHKYILK